MRDRASIARRLLDERATMRELERRGVAEWPAGHVAVSLDSVGLLVYRAMTQSLAWALDVDLNQIDVPMSLLAPVEMPATVQLHRLELGERPHAIVMWLAEIPAHHDVAGPDYSTEGWSFFLHDEQAHQLLSALTAALTPAQSAITPTRLPTLRPAPVAPVAPVAPDVEGGYADYAGLAAFASAFADDDQDDDQDDDDDDPPYGAMVAGPRAPRPMKGA